MHEPEVVLLMEVQACHNSTEVLQPREQPLDLPPPLVAAQWPPILRGGFLSVRLVRRDHLDALLAQLLAQRVRVIRLVANQPLRQFSGKDLKKSSQTR
jgi:hypothetical protein